MGPAIELGFSLGDWIGLSGYFPSARRPGVAVTLADIITEGVSEGLVKANAPAGARRD